MQPSRFPGIDDQLDELVAQNQGARADRVQPTSSRYPAIDAHLGEIQRTERLAVENTLDLALPRNPDKAAEAQTLADRFRLDMETVQAKQDELARIARGEDIRKALVASPILRRQMTDMKFAEIAHDDVETLSGIESVMGAIKNTPRALMAGLQRTSAGIVGIAQTPFDLMDPVGELFSGTVLPENPLRRVSQGMGQYRQWIDKQAEASMPKGSGNVENGYYSGMASLSRNVASLPLLFLPGGQNAALTGMVAPVVGEEYGKARDAGLTPTQSLVYGSSQGAIEWATEKLPVSKLLGDLKVGETFLKTLGKQALYEVPGEQAATILQDLNTWAAIDSNKGKTIKDYLAERPDAAVQTLVATLVGTGGQVSVVKAVDMAMGRIAFKEERAAAAEQHAAALGQLGELAKASKALARSPQSVAQFVQEAAKEQGAENVYVDAKVFNQMMQDRGIGLDQIPGPLRDQLAEATARGGDVVIPVGTFTTEIASTEYGQALADHVKLDPNGMSRAEAVEFMQTQGEQLQQEVERTLTEQQSNTAFQASREAVQTQIQQELDALGRFTPEKNAADAVLFASYYATRAAQLGVTPEALYDQRRVRFAAEAVAGQQFQQVAIDTPEFSNWFGDSKVVDSAGKPLVVYHGSPSPDAISEFQPKNGGIYFSSDRKTAEEYTAQRGMWRGPKTGSVTEAFVALKNPLVIDATGKRNDNIPVPWQQWKPKTFGNLPSGAVSVQAAAEHAKANGHDGLIVRNVIDTADIKDTRKSNVFVAFESSQVKSATGNRGTFDPADPNILNQPAFHGTPHRGITKFSTDKIGTGEGFQAFGWGLYFTNKRDIAEWYREKLTAEDATQAPRRFVKGVEYQPGTGGYFAVRLVEGGTLAAARKDVASWIKDAEGWSEARKADKGEQETLRVWKEALVILQDATSKKDFTSKSAQGQLYEVELPEDDNLLMWDKPLAKQPEKVLKALKDSGIAKELKDNLSDFASPMDTRGKLNGENIYAFLKWKLGSDRAASERLLSLGIQGTNYPAGSIAGNTNTRARNYVIFSGDDVAIKNQFYQPARGAFSPESFTITLLKGADLSTSLHEGAHFFFENDIALAAELVREQVSPETQNEGALQILADVSALMNFHGITGTIEEQLAQWYSMDFEQRRTAHERVAESFEAYLFDGNAPSVELAPYFQRFREWMLSVYKSIKDFLTQNPEAGKLDDTVRGVFDRMLATREQIEMAQAARSMMPLFASAEQGGYTAQEFQAYQDMARQSSDAAADEMEARALRDMAYSRNAKAREVKKLQREAAGLRSEVRIEARRQVMSQPVYRAMQFLKGRLTKDDKAALKQEQVKATTGLNVETDSLFVAIAKLGGLDRASVEKMWGWDPAERTPQPAFGHPLLRREGGLSIDAMAERLAEVGYLMDDGSADYMAEFEDKFSAEYRGDTQYSISYDYAQAMERRAGDNIAPGQLSAGRIDLQSLKNMGLPPTIAETLEERGMTAKDGLHPDVAVDMIPGVNEQFADGEQLVRALAQAPDMKEAIENLTDQMMLEQYGELATPEAIERSADLAIHNDVRARLVASELNAIHRMAGKPKILATAAKEYAGKMINRLMLANVKPHLYAAAKARAARASEKAFKTGDLQAAAVEKRNELINAYAAVAAKEALAEARATVKYFNSLTKGSDKKTVQRGMDPDVLNAARFILGAYGVGERSAQRAADYLDVLRRNNPELSKVLEPSIQATLANARPLEQLTIEQLRGLREEIEAMAHLAKRSRMLEVGGNLLDREEVVAELDAKLEEIGVPEVIPGEKSAITPIEKAKSSLQYAGAILRRVEQWAEAKDGAFGGPFLRYVFQPVKEAADRYRADRSKYRKAYLDLVKGIAPSMKGGLIEAPELGYTFGKGHNGVAMAELLHAILHTGNESNKRKLLLGRGWAVDMGDGQMDTGRWDAFVERMHREGILRKEHYDFAQGVWDLLDSMKPAAQKTHRDVFGMYFQEVTADEFNTPFGTYRGGYVPAQADPQIVKDASLRELAEQENQSMAYSFPTTSKGFTKARVEYNRPLKLDLRSLSQHIDKVLLFTHMEPAVRDVNRVITDRNLSGKLARVDPAAIDGMLAPWLKRSASQQVETPVSGDGGLSRVLSTIRSRAGIALMFGNISNTLQQISGLPGAANKVRPGLLAKATASYMAGPKAMAEHVAQSSVYMKERMANEVAAIHNQMSEILLDPSYLERGQAWTMKHAYFLQSAMDNVIGPIVWTGAYNQAIQDGMADVDAVRFADGVVRQTQGSTLPEDISRSEGGGPVTGNPFVRLFTQFIGYFNMLANTNATELNKVMREVGIKKGATKALGIVFFGLLAPAWIAEAIAIAMRGGPEDDDDDGYLDDWLMQVAGLGSVKFALAGIPFVGQFANASINRWNGNPVDDRVSLSPGVSLAEGAVGAPYSVYQAMVNDGNASKAVKDVGTAVTLLTGLPAHWAARPIGYMTGVAEERIEPEGPLDVLRGLVTGTASPESRQ